MASLIKNWRIVLLIACLIIAFLIIGARGLQFGIDFSGGTLFQVQLGEPIADAGERAKIVTTIQQRLDWTGLRDTSVNFFGDSFVIAQVAETDPETVERIEGLLKKQGVFEATIDGNTIFTGEDIIEMPKDPAKGYGLYRKGDGFRWVLPFVLKSNAANRFTELTFHRCELISYSPDAGREYECDKTYFFIDRPKKAVLIIPDAVYYNDEQILLQGLPEEGIPTGTKIKEVLLNVASPYLVVSDDGFSAEQMQELQGLAAENKFAVIPDTLNEEMQQQLLDLGFELRAFPVSGQAPFIFNAAGLRSIISLSEGVAQMDVARLQDAQPMDKLQIFGFAFTPEDAEQRRSDLEILLQSGSLSVSVRSISKETISPLLGENFLQNAALMGLLALSIVAVVLFLRYRILKLTFPMIFIGLSEVILTAAFASLISKFDLGAVAGIVAAVGTGVDNQIVISDELIRGEELAAGSLFSRVKRAFFIVTAAACTTLATMLPIILIGFGLGRLVGFAITTTIGVLTGVLVTRPAFAEIAKAILERK